MHKPEISSDSFAKGLAAFLKAAKQPPSDMARQKLIGTWQRVSDAGNTRYYYTFKADGTFETNEYVRHTPDSGKLTGKFGIGPDNVVYMEPHERLKMVSLMVSPSGDSLIIGLKDGMSFEYKKM